jgi:hypothetical protein
MIDDHSTLAPVDFKLSSVHCLESSHTIACWSAWRQVSCVTMPQNLDTVIHCACMSLLPISPSSSVFTDLPIDGDGIPWTLTNIDAGVLMRVGHAVKPPVKRSRSAFGPSLR